MLWIRVMSLLKMYQAMIFSFTFFSQFLSLRMIQTHRWKWKLFCLHVLHGGAFVKSINDMSSRAVLLMALMIASWWISPQSENAEVARMYYCTENYSRFQDFRHTGGSEHWFASAFCKEGPLLLILVKLICLLKMYSLIYGSRVYILMGRPSI